MTVDDLLRRCGLVAEGAAGLFAVPFDDPLPDDPLPDTAPDGRVPRHVIAHALLLALGADLLERVPDAARYAHEQERAGRQIVLDHGAIRTVAGPTASAVPPGIAQVTRILEPLGWSQRDIYPLARLKMTGRSFAHDDLPEQIGQRFVSELHPDDFSVEFRQAVERVLATAIDPIDDATADALDELSSTHSLPADRAIELLPRLVACFARLHSAPSDRDYDVLLKESAEMAWIATEGTAFNHATDRVTDVAATADEQRALGRPMKDAVEVSATGRVRQTAYRATPVERDFVTAEGDTVQRTVPGSFFEFIDRQPLRDGTGLDLAFDTGNAQGIFAMTDSRTAADNDNDE